MTTEPFDAVRFAEFLAEDVVHRDVALNETLHGLAEVRGFVERLAAGFPDVEWRPAGAVVESPDRFAVLWATTRTSDGERRSVEGVSIIERRHGRTVRNTDYRNRG